jgi:uncharacterized short protein YbdD (DUF466 family)
MWRRRMHKAGIGIRGSGVGESGVHDHRSASRGPRFARFRRIVKQVCGMPDYERHREHVRAHGCPLLSEREYYDQYLATRYGGGGSRCC